MNDPPPDERSAWARVTQLFGSREGVLESRSTYLVRTDPARLSIVLARAKFLARLITSKRRVVELGPVEPWGSRILAEAAASYVGIDADEPFITAASPIFAPLGLVFQSDWPAERQTYDTLVALDFARATAQSGLPSDELFDRSCDLLSDDGIVALGAEAATCAPLRTLLAARFAKVFSFCCCGEAIVADDAPDTGDVLLLAVQPKRGMLPSRSKSLVDQVLVAADVGGPQLELGRHLCHWLYNSPRRLLHSMSYYRFAAELIGSGSSSPGRRVLDIGCGEGWGTWLLAERCGSAIGLDFDAPAIDVARRNFTDARVRFVCSDVFEVTVEPYAAVVTYDCIEHILPENVDRFWQRIVAHLPSDGLAVVGSPSLTSDTYATPATRAGHVNLYSGDQLETEMGRYFRTVLLFSANDEIVHTGFRPLAHYYIAVGIGPR